MRKIIISAVLTSAIFAGGFTSTQGSGGFKNSGNMANTTIKEALNLKDDAAVVLFGNITSQIKSEHYNFKDANGDVIEVEIDDHIWGNINADENTKLKISGKIDKDLTKTSIDVKTIEIVK